MSNIKSFEKTQQAELDSWFSDDPQINRDKRIRETIRYPLLKKQMGLDYLDTSEMVVYDIGCGPYGGISSILTAKAVNRIDPLMDEYKKHYPITNGYAKKAEDLKEELGLADLVIITNALDHFSRPELFLNELDEYMKPGAYFAHLHAIDNAYSHPHEAHAYNINPELLHYFLQDEFETCWSMDYQHDGLTYGWRKQPAFSGLYRKVTGYK